MDFETELDVISFMLDGGLDDVLQSALSQDKTQILNPENYRVFESVCDAFTEVFQMPANVQLHKHSCIASATIHMDDLHLTREKIAKLFVPVSMCSTFAIDPCDEGGFDISVTVNNVLMEI